MRKFIRLVILSAFFILPLLSTPRVLAAAPDTADPNAALKKLMAPIEDLEKVKKLNNDMAIKHFTGLIQKSPKQAVNYAKRGQAYSGNRDYEKALKDYEKAMSLDPKLPDPYVGRAVVRLMKKDYDRCWEDVHKAEALGGKFWPAFMDALKAGSGRDK